MKLLLTEMGPHYVLSDEDSKDKVNVNDYIFNYFGLMYYISPRFNSS